MSACPVFIHNNLVVFSLAEQLLLDYMGVALQSRALPAVQRTLSEFLADYEPGDAIAYVNQKILARVLERLHDGSAIT